MTTKNVFDWLEAEIAKYDLLCHPFYKAWSAGKLTRADLREYARDYYHHVEAFPRYLEEFAKRLDHGELRRAVEANMRDEQGGEDAFGQLQRSHAELWLDFAESMGASRNMREHEPVVEVRELILFFNHMASEAAPEEALAAFYAYESQVPRIAKEKARGLLQMYGADDRARAYFVLHTAADVYHAQVWRQQLEKHLQTNPGTAEKAVARGGAAARALWRALDGIDARRLAWAS
jgi:pyrroloquinoline-quinone synthase